MSVESAYAGLRWRLARLVADKASRAWLNDEDWEEADKQINAMTNSELLAMLSAEEDS